jgi:hypothetical protein
MKKNYPKTTGILVFLSLLVSSCAVTNELTIPITNPAPVTVPSNIQTIGILDRSLPSKKNAATDKIDKILSAEGKNLDKEGAHQAVTGLNDELSTNSRFTKVKAIENDDIRSPGMGVYPAALPWETVERLCAENEVDALFTLSFYDTDAVIDYQVVPVKLSGPLGIKIDALEHHATITTLIKTGWRIYDPTNKYIIDQYARDNTVISKGVGINPAKAVEAVLNRKEGVLQISNDLGHSYGLRLLAYNTRVRRIYFIKGTNNFEIAMRRARTGDWDGAADLWEKEVDNTDGKIAGRACYNMAIINEINGNLQAAIDWASKAYADYEIKEALSYIKVLKYRVQENEELRRQLEE